MDIKKLTDDLLTGLIPEGTSAISEVGEASSKPFPYVKEHDDVELEEGGLFGTSVYGFSDKAGHYYNVVLEYEGLQVDANFTADESYEPTNSNELFTVMTTVINILKKDTSEYPKDKVAIIKYTPASTKSKQGAQAKGSEQRDRLYQAYFRKNFPGSTIEKEGTDTLVYLREGYKGKRTNNGAPGTLKAKISKLYGGDVTIEKARKLKNRENATPHDKRQANWFINFHSKNEAADPQAGEAAPYGSGYAEVEETLKTYIQQLTEYMGENGMNIEPLPAVEFKYDPENAIQPLGHTAYYNPNDRVIVLYTAGRHPKDILRSFSHEMIHHVQNLENRLGNITTTNVNEDDYLKELEREAYERGNMYFRSWENSLRGDNGVRYVTGFRPREVDLRPITAEED